MTYHRWSTVKHDRKAAPVLDTMTPEQRAVYDECHALLDDVTAGWKAERKRANENDKLLDLWQRRINNLMSPNGKGDSWVDLMRGRTAAKAEQDAASSEPRGDSSDLDLDHLARALQLVDEDSGLTIVYYREHWAPRVAEVYRSLARGLPSADDVKGILK